MARNRTGAARTATLALLAILSLAGLTTLWLGARSGAGIDFYQMWVGARIAREPAFYSPSTAARAGEEYLRRATTEEHSVRRLAVAQYRRKLELVSTPFLYTLYAPLRGTYEHDLLAFQIASLVALVAALAMLVITFRYDAMLSAATFAILLNFFEPIATDIRVANVNAFVLLLVACGAWLTRERRFVRAGAVLACATLAKPYLIFVLALSWAVWILARRWRDLGAQMTGAAIAGIAGIAISSLYFGTARIWIEWLEALRTMPQSMVPLSLGNFALAQIIRDTTGLRVATILALATFLIALAVAIRVRAAAQHQDLLLIGLGAVIGLLGSPLVWMHYLVMALPLLACLARGRRRLAIAVALTLLAVTPWDQVIPTTLMIAMLVNAGLLIAFVAGLLDLAAPETA